MVRFRRADPGQTEVTATVAPGHVITKERVPAQRRGESGYAIFTCTCGWQAQTFTGVSNLPAVLHRHSVLQCSHTE